MSNIEIKPATLEDIDQIVDIEQKTFVDAWSKKSFIQELSNKFSLFYVAKIDNEVIGYVIMWLVEDESYILNLAVKENFRRKKVGKKLLQKMLALAKENHLNTVYLEVRRKNLPAISLYKSFGFDVSAVRPNFYKDDDALVMYKKL